MSIRGIFLLLIVAFLSGCSDKNGYYVAPNESETGEYVYLNTDILFSIDGDKVTFKNPIIKREKEFTVDQVIYNIVYSEVNRLGEKADLNHIDVSKVTNMSYLFSEKGTSKFEGNIEKWDVSSVEDFTCMFSNSKKEMIDTGSWNFKKGLTKNSFDNWKYIDDMNRVFGKHRNVTVSNSPDIKIIKNTNYKTGTVC